MHLSFDARKNDVEIEKLRIKIKEEKDKLEKQLLQIELEEKIYGKAGMELVAKHRMREVATWSKLKKEFDDGNFDKNDVDTHQAHSYLLRLQHQKNTITLGTSQHEAFNAIGQLDTLERVIREKIEEVILATSATVEGQTTAYYIQNSLKQTNVKITKLAQGLPVGGEIESLDDGTLFSAFKNRTGIYSSSD